MLITYQDSDHKDNVTKSIITTFSDVINLTVLIIGSNNLTALPDTIGNLTNLTKLNVYNNHLTTLPDTIGNLTNLVILNIRSNHFTTLPPRMEELTNLAKMWFDGIILRSITDFRIVLRLGYLNYLIYTVDRWARYRIILDPSPPTY